MSQVPATDSLHRFVLTYRRPDSSRLAVEGRFERDNIHVGLRRIDVSKVLLTSWKPHLVNGLPYPATEIEGPYAGYVTLP